MRILAILLAAGAGTQPIVGGVVDRDDPAVVAVVTRRARCEETALELQCSGVLVAPRVVVTASACLPLPAAAGVYEVVIGPTASVAEGTFIAVSDVRTMGDGIALLRLADVASPAPVTRRSAPLDPSEVGGTVRVVGYGSVSPGTPADGVKRQGGMVISAIDAMTLRATPSPSTGCRKDLGAPVFRDIGAGEELVGIVTEGDPACVDHITAQRIDALAAVIQPYIDESATSPPGWPPTAVEPAALCGAQCQTNADCPAALACIREQGVDGECLLFGLGAGNYDEPCTRDDDCGDGGTCARLSPDACRCFTRCDDLPPPVDDCGCAARSRDTIPWDGLPPAVVALGVLARRRRRLRR
jgi:hypothetical protein